MSHLIVLFDENCLINLPRNGKNVLTLLFDRDTFLLVSVLKINDVEGEMIRVVIIRENAMLRDQITQQAQQDALFFLQRKLLLF